MTWWGVQAAAWPFRKDKSTCLSTSASMMIRSLMANPDRMPHIVTFVEAYVHNIQCPPGGYFHIHSVAWICPDQSQHQLWNFHHATVVPCFLGSSPGWFCQATKDSKITHGGARIRTTRGPSFPCLGASAWITRLAGRRDNWWRYVNELCFYQYFLGVCLEQ